MVFDDLDGHRWCLMSLTFTLSFTLIFRGKQWHFSFNLSIYLLVVQSSNVSLSWHSLTPWSMLRKESVTFISLITFRLYSFSNSSCKNSENLHIRIIRINNCLMFEAWCKLWFMNTLSVQHFQIYFYNEQKDGPYNCFVTKNYQEIPLPIVSTMIPCLAL